MSTITGIPAEPATWGEPAERPEIAAGIITLARLRIGGFIVMAWLLGIALSLLASGAYLDVAIRDVVMAIGAFTLANLTSIITNTNSRRGL